MFFRYQLSDLLKIPHDCAEFAKAIEDFPVDDGWDRSDMVQAGYLKAGLKRYKLDYQGTLNTKSKTTSQREVAESSTYGSKALGNSASSNPTVKIELAAHALLASEMKVISQGEAKLSGAIKTLKALLVDLEISKKTEAPARAAQAVKAIDAVEKSQHMLLTFLGLFKVVPSDDEAQVDCMRLQIKGRADESSDVLDAAKQVVKQLQNFMQC